MNMLNSLFLIYYMCLFIHNYHYFHESDWGGPVPTPRSASVMDVCVLTSVLESFSRPSTSLPVFLKLLLHPASRLLKR